MDNLQKEKYEKNTRRVVGISALRKIRSLVDGYTLQDKKAKRTIIVITSIVFILTILVAYGIMFTPDSEPLIIKGIEKDINSTNKSLNLTGARGAPPS